MHGCIVYILCKYPMISVMLKNFPQSKTYIEKSSLNNMRHNIFKSSHSIILVSS